MKLERREDGWWVAGAPWEDCGPYDTKDEALDDLRGLKRFIRYEHDPVDFLGEADAKIWRRKVKEQLKELERQAEIAYRELSERKPRARDVGTNLIRALSCLQTLSQALAAGQPKKAIELGKVACEEIADRADRAYRGGDSEFGDYLKGKVEELAPVVAKLLPLTKHDLREQNETAA